jgi:hypothetical protein
VKAVFSVLGALMWLAALAVFGLCLVSLWTAAREGSRRDRVLMFVAGLAVMAVCLVPASIGTYRQTLPMPIFITAAWVPWLARGLCAAALIALAVSSRLSGRRHGFRAAVAALFVFAPFAECARFASDPAPWRAYGALQHPTGARYVYLESSFLQGQLLTISRVDVEHWYGTDYTALELTNGDWPRSYISLVRQDTTNDRGYGQLLLAADSRIVAVRSSNHAYMALDPVSGRSWSHEAIYELSPFIMLDDRARTSRADVAQTVSTITELCSGYREDRARLAESVEHGSISGVPSRRVLRAELTNPNASVRGAAQQLLATLEEHCLPGVPASQGDGQ